MLDCPICRQEVRQLVIPPDTKKFGCRSCVYGAEQRPTAYNVNLGQSTDAWRGPDGKLHKISVGKKIEIDGRYLSKEGIVVSKDNKNKEARY